MTPDEQQPSPGQDAGSLADVRRLLLADDARVLRIVFRDSDTFQLRAFYQLDHSIDGVRDQWSATIVQPVGGRRPDFHRLFQSGTGLDFLATDIASITDESRALLYRAPDATTINTD